MSEKNTNNQIILVVGAGASISIGIPGMQGMVTKYRSQVTTGSPEEKGLQLLGNAGVDYDLEAILLEIERLEEMPDSAAFKAVYKEIINSGRSSKSEAEAIKDLQRSTGALRDDVLRWMADTCLQFDRTQATSNWGELVKILKRLGVSIFTTNYDFAIEEIAQNQGITVVDNFKVGRHNRRFWDHSLNSFEANGLKVMKLHGSVDWYATQDRLEIEKLEYSVVRNREGIRVDRVAIFPTRFKDIYESVFFSIYKIFLEALNHARIVIVIGHSLRDEYIRAAIRERFRESTFRLIYIGPNMPPDLANLKMPNRDLSQQVIHVEAKFEDIASILAYILNKYPPEEIGKALKKAIDFDRKTKLTLNKRITHVEQGEVINLEMKVLAPAIPPAKIEALLEPSSGSPEASFEIEVVDPNDGKQVTIEGIEENTIEASFQIPDDVPDGEYTLWFTAVGQDGAPLMKKDYVCKVGKVASSADEEGIKPEQEIDEIIEGNQGSISEQ